jgi:hypothetical protein
MLTLAEANQAIAGALAKAQSMKTKIAVSVCDQGGHLLAFQRMDGAFLESAAGAIGKAITQQLQESPAAIKAMKMTFWISNRCGVWLARAYRSERGREVFRSLVTPRGWARSVWPGAQQFKKTSNARKRA